MLVFLLESVSFEIKLYLLGVFGWILGAKGVKISIFSYWLGMIKGGKGWFLSFLRI